MKAKRKEVTQKSPQNPTGKEEKKKTGRGPRLAESGFEEKGKRDDSRERGIIYLVLST